MYDTQVKMLIEILKEKQVLTELEEDIVDTWNELSKVPFERNSAENRILKNNLKHPDIFAAISILPTTTLKPFSQVDDEDVRHNLAQQLIALSSKRQRQR